jgi:two-component system response regulator NreC
MPLPLPLDYALPSSPGQPRDTAARLSKRESTAVRYIALGYSNKQIAARLNVSIKTVETYKFRAMEKLNVRSRVGLVWFAIERGWMTVESASEIIHST